MSRTLVTSTRSRAGKTTLALGLAINCESACAYVKPVWDQFGEEGDETVDNDVSLMDAVEGIAASREHAQLPQSYEHAVTRPGPRNPADDMATAVSSACAETDGPLIIEGPSNFSFGMSLGLDSASMAERLGAGLLVIADGDLGAVMDKLALCREHFAAREVKVLGFVVNKVPPAEIDVFRERLEEAFPGDDMRFLGIFPHQPQLHLIPVRQVLNELNGKLLAGEKGLDATIGQILVGAMAVSSTVKMHLFHTPDKLLITGGDRIEMQLANLDTPMSGMVLTGGVYPDPKVIAMADDKGVPLVLVRPDTFTIVAQVERMSARTLPGDSGKVELIRAMVKEGLDLSRIL
jgi:BioD-like phosphotransacetylase family protein